MSRKQLRRLSLPEVALAARRGDLQAQLLMAVVGAPGPAWNHNR
jgi:hypothetical protein